MIRCVLVDFSCHVLVHILMLFMAFYSLSVATSALVPTSITDLSPVKAVLQQIEHYLWYCCFLFLLLPSMGLTVLP